MEPKKHGIVRRAGVGLVKAWSYSLGITSLAREGQRIGGSVVGNVRRTLADGPHNYRHETFEQAVARLGLDEAHLLRQAKLFQHYATWYFVATMAATAWLAYVPFTDHPFNALFVTLSALGLTGSKWLKWHFRFCQIRDHELYSFSPWFFSPGRW